MYYVHGLGTNISLLGASQQGVGHLPFVDVHRQHLSDLAQVDLNWLEVFSRVQGVGAGLYI